MADPVPHNPVTTEQIITGQERTARLGPKGVTVPDTKRNSETSDPTTTSPIQLERIRKPNPLPKPNSSGATSLPPTFTQPTQFNSIGSNFQSHTSSPLLSSPTMHIPAIPPLFLHLLTTIPSLLLSHLLHFPSFSLYSLCTYIYPDSAPSSTPRAVLRPANSKPSKRNSSSTPFDTTAAQLYRLRLDHSALSSRHRFPSFHLSLLLSFSFSLPSLLLHYFNSSSLAFFPFLFVSISATFLVVTLVRLSLEKSASRRSEKSFSLFAFVASPIISLILIQFLSINPPPGIASAFTGLISALVFIPAARFSRCFWLGTDQLRFDLPVLSCSSIGLVLLYSTALVSLASPALFLKSFLPPFFLATAEAIQVPVLAVAAVLQILSLRAMVQMYVNEAVTCWYQQLHVTRISDLDYARAKMFLHNHHLCTVATQLFAPPALVLLLLGLSQLRGNLFEGVEIFQSSADLSDIVKEMALFMAWWVMFSWSIVTMAILACYRYGLLLIS
ncbi:hypothetical protein LUZ63_009408 [Rhynchospora breviuscula]|uniref:Transmembrane protein n=1 Tax=Rhynchospora breviuscula TaxID=2022672 RepID=A0A9Q0CF45_9POAL|nr:hypothetical protein LUZ63_009408 [Rhynchospora breviuscula]